MLSMRVTANIEMREENATSTRTKEVMPLNFDFMVVNPHRSNNDSSKKH